MTEPTIIRATRFYGPGLPPEGVEDVHEAYTLGLRYARQMAVNRLFGAMSSPADIAEDYDELVRTVSEATDAFIESNGFLSDLIEQEIRRGGIEGPIE